MKNCKTCENYSECKKGYGLCKESKKVDFMVDENYSCNKHALMTKN